MVKENSLGAKVDFFLILNTAIEQKMSKKKKKTIRILGTLKKKVKQLNVLVPFAECGVLVSWLLSNNLF